jgi:hypothetical protein
LNTPANDDDEASNEPGPGFSPGPGFTPPPAPPVEPLVAMPTSSRILAAPAGAPIAKRVKRWHIVGKGTRSVAIFMASAALFALLAYGFFNALVPAAILAAPLIYLLTSSETIPAGVPRRG